MLGLAPTFGKPSLLGLAPIGEDGGKYGDPRGEDFIPVEDDTRPSIEKPKHYVPIMDKFPRPQSYGSAFLVPPSYGSTSLIPQGNSTAQDTAVRSSESSRAPNAQSSWSPILQTRSNPQLRRSLELMTRASTLRAMRRSPENDDSRSKRSPDASQTGSNNTPAPLKVQGGRISKAGKSVRKPRHSQAMKAVRKAARQTLQAVGLAAGSQEPASSDDLRNAHLNSAVNNLKIIIKSRPNAIKFASEVVEPSLGTTLGPRIVFFTDGSDRGPKGLAGAAVSYKRCLAETTDWFDVSAGIVGKAGSNEAEMIAVGIALNIARCEIQALDQLAAGSLPNYPTIFVITDSQSTLNWIDQYIRGNVTQPRIVRKLYHPAFTQLLDPLTRLESLGVKVELHWTKGHKGGHDGNHRADRLAGDAVDRVQAKIDPIYVRSVSKQPYKIHITEATSPSVMRMFQDQKENVALLLEDAHNVHKAQVPALMQAPGLSQPLSQKGEPVSYQTHSLTRDLPQHTIPEVNRQSSSYLGAAPVLHQPLALRKSPRRHREGGLLTSSTRESDNSEDEDRKRSRPVEGFKRMVSPLRTFVQNVTGHKLKHEETSPSKSKGSIGEKITGYFSESHGQPNRGDDRAENTDIEMIDLTGDDDEGSSNQESITKKPQYVVRYEAGIEVLDLTGDLA